MKKCPYCGKEYPDDAAVCALDETLLDTPFYSQDNSPIAKRENERIPYAGFGIRYLARVIDGFLGIGVGTAAGFAAGGALMMLTEAGIITPEWEYRVHGISGYMLLFGFFGNISYHFFCEGIHGATLGKLCCGLRVISENGQPSTLRGALIRSMAYLIDGLFFGLPAYYSIARSPLNQRYGDVWGKTAVVKVKEANLGPQRTPALFVAGLLAGMGCWGMLLEAAIILKVI